MATLASESGPVEVAVSLQECQHVHRWHLRSTAVFLRALGGTAVSRVSPGLWASLPRFLPISQDSGSTYGVQGLEFLPQVSHSALLAGVHWLPGSLFVWPILCRHLQILALPYHGC